MKQTPWVELRVERMTRRGLGLAPWGEGFIGIPSVEPGERARVYVTQDARGRPLGVPLAILDPAPHRVDPRCDQQPRCPGCPLRHLSAARQWALKAARHERILNVGLAGERHRAEEDAYRAQVTARAFDDPQGGLVLGMMGHDALIDLRRCPAQTPEIRALLAVMASALEAAGLRAWDEATGAGALRHVIASAGPTPPGEPFNGRVVLGLSAPAITPALLDTLARLDVEAPLFYEPVHPSRYDTLRDVRPLRAAKSAALRFNVEGDAFKAHLPAWSPQAPGSAAALRALTLDALQPLPHHRALELGCGVGTLSLSLARRVQSLLGVDMIRAAAEDAQLNAAQAGVHNATFRQGRAEHAARRLLSGGFQAELLLIHAMGRPMGPEVMRRFDALGVQRALYWGPNPVAIREDLDHLKAPWRVTRLIFLDQLPGTTHLLSGLLIERA
ncbi:methyltransferase domain-containing protein [Myxococcota bacterium]|nr:methyltransferase domain-containing protein [Myxococcota bacterium]